MADDGVMFERRAAITAGVAAAFAIAVFAATSDVWVGDALSFRQVAVSPFGTGAALRPDAVVHGVAYRYGRILYPLVGWVLAGGRSALVAWTLPVVAVGSFAACAWLAVRLCGRQAVFVAGFPTLFSSTVLLYGEPLAVALLLGVWVAYFSGRRRVLLAVAGLLPLAREVMIVGVVPIVWAERGDRRRWTPLVVASVVPYAAWAVWVRMRVEAFPFTDPAVSRREAVGVPFVGLVRAVRDAGGDVAIVIGAVLVAVVAAATFVVAVRMLRTSLGDDRLLAWSAVLFSIVALCIGAQGYRFPGDAFRVLLPAHIMMTLPYARRSGDVLVEPEERGAVVGHDELDCANTPVRL